MTGDHDLRHNLEFNRITLERNVREGGREKWEKDRKKDGEE